MVEGIISIQNFGDDQPIFRHRKSGELKWDRHFLLLFWGCGRLISSEKILGLSEKITDRMHHGIISPEFYGHIKSQRGKVYSRDDQ